MYRRSLQFAYLLGIAVIVAGCSSDTTGGKPAPASPTSASTPTVAQTKTTPPVSQETVIVTRLKAYFAAHPTDDSGTGDGTASLDSCPLGDPVKLAQSFGNADFTAKVKQELPNANRDHLYYIDGAFNNDGVYDIVCKLLSEDGPEGGRFEVFLYPAAKTPGQLSDDSGISSPGQNIASGTLVANPAPSASDDSSLAYLLSHNGLFSVEAQTEFHDTTPPWANPALVTTLPGILAKLAALK